MSLPDPAALKRRRKALLSNYSAPPGAEFQGQNIPPELVAIPQWIGWRFVWNSDRGEYTKVPCNLARGPKKDGRFPSASTTDPKTWTDYATAVERLSRDRDGNLDGLGFVFRDGGGLFGVDLDNVRDPDTGAVVGWAAEIVARFATYTEVSPTGFGLKLVGRGTLPAAKHRSPVADIEVYAAGRYFTITGVLS